MLHSKMDKQIITSPIFTGSRLITLFALLLSLTIITRGSGIRDIYELSVYALIITTICFNERKGNSIWGVCLLFIHVLMPGISLLWGFTAFLFSLSTRTFPLTILCLALWLGETCDIIPNTILALGCLFVTSLTLYLIPRKIQKYIATTLGIITFCFALPKMPLLNDRMYAEKYGNSPYASSDIFCKVTGTKYIDTKNIKKDTRIIRETPFYTNISSHQPGIHVFEIDYKDNDESVDKEIWQQPISWHDNQLIGNQYYLEAIRNDGGLYSNKGLTLKSDIGTSQLSFAETLTQSQPLVISKGPTLLLHDSDYVSSFLANYQKSFISELAGNNIRPNLIRAINLLFLIFLILGLYKFKYQKHFIAFLLPVTLLFFYLVYAKPVEGEIRLVGEITNSHENNKFDGVVKKLVFSGFNYTVGNKNAKILVVQKGHNAEVDTETIVLAEDDCTIMCKNKKLSVINTPIGNVNGIIDARQWKCEDRVIDGIVEIDGVKLIATGSPALQSWKDLLK